MKRLIQVMVGFIMVAGLVLGPIGPGAFGRRAQQGRAPGRTFAATFATGWDHGGSPGC
jgi:hypothetical protein